MYGPGSAPYGGAMTHKDVGARVRAARRMAGIEQRKALTDQLDLPRFGEKVLGKVERGERELYEHEAEALAKILPVNAAFFYETPAEAMAPETSQLDRIEELLHRAQGDREAMEGRIAQQNANLLTQTQVLEQIVAALADLPAVAVGLADLLQRLEADDSRQRRVGGEG